MERLGAFIAKFRAGCVQQQQLSGQPGYKKNITMPDGGQLRYSYNDGQETMDIRLSPKESSSEETKEEKTESSAWDWLVVDLEIPVKDTSGTPMMLYHLQAAARFYNPALADILDGGDPPEPIFGGASLQRFAVDDQGVGVGQQEPVTADAQANPRLMWAGAPRAQQLAAPEVESGENLFKCSLLVDIRSQAQLPIIEFDLWAQLSPTKLTKNLKGIIVRTPDVMPDLTTWFGVAELHRTEAGILDYIATVDSSLAAGVTDEVFHSVTSDLNRWIPYPYTVTNFPDNIATDNSQYVMSGLTWLNNNRSGSREIYGNQFSTLWRDGFWDGDTWSEFEAALDEIAPAAGTINFPSPISELGVNITTQYGGRFWCPVGSPPVFIWGFGDPGTPPPADLVFNAGSGGAVESVFFEFFNVWNTYVFKPQLSSVSTSTTVTTDCAIKAVALKGQVLDPAPEGPGDSQLMWTERDCVLATAVMGAVSSGSTANWRYGQWEQKGKYPSRWNMSVIKGAEAVPVDNQDGTAQTHAMIDNMKYLGRVKFDQTGGGASFAWTAAADVLPEKLPVMPA